MGMNLCLLHIAYSNAQNVNILSLLLETSLKSSKTGAMPESALNKSLKADCSITWLLRSSLRINLNAARSRRTSSSVGLLRALCLKDKNHVMQYACHYSQTAQ